MTTHSLSAVAPRRRSIATRLTSWTRPLLRPLAGRRWFALWGILEHQGRKSGRIYRIPVAPRRTADGFIIPVAFGSDADWTLNVLASGRCAIVWKGRRYEARDARIIDRTEAAPAFSGIQRAMMSRTSIERFLRVTTVDPEP